MSLIDRRILPLTAWLLSVCWVGSVAAEQRGVGVDSSSLLENAREKAEKDRFFGDADRESGPSGYFSRASDRSRPLVSSRFELKSLTERGAALPNQEHPLPLRSMSRYYGVLDGLPNSSKTPTFTPRTGSAAATHNRALSPRGALMGADATSRYQIANDLKSRGYDFNWREHSFEELYGYRTRIEIANRLQERGVEVDWSVHSGEELARMARYVALGESLEKNGRLVNLSLIHI